MVAIPLSVEILLRILQIAEETRAIVIENQRNLEMLKLSGRDSRTDVASTDDSVLQLIQGPLMDADDIEAFNSELDDRQKYKNVASYINRLSFFIA